MSVIRTVLVTGTTGFIGHTVCPLLRARGWRVRAGLRQPLPVDAARDERARIDEETVTGELDAHVDWTAALGGVDTVVHLAGLAHVPAVSGARETYRRINTNATVALARAAAATGVRRFVFLSSARVHGETSGAAVWTESSPFHPTDDYSRSKYEAERGLTELAKTSTMEVVVLRPPLVYGPQVKANFLRLMQWIERGRPLPFGGVQNRRSLLYVENLADAIACALDHPRAAGRSFLVSDGEDASTPELARRVGRALGRPARLWSLPPSFLRAGLRLAGRGADSERLLGSFALDSSAIRATLDWTPPVSMEEGLRRTACWFRGVAMPSKR